MSDTITVSGLPLGAYGANSFVGFTNVAGNVVSNTTWTAVAAKYIVPSDNLNFTAETTATSRDFELTSYARFGGWFGRLANSSAHGLWGVYLLVNEDANNLEIGIATNINNTGTLFTTDVTHYTLVQIPNLNTITGYTNLSDGRTWTFGASGFDLYVKMNGTEVLRVRDYRVPLSVGQLAIKSGAGAYGFRDVTANYLASASLFSVAPNLDFRDFGIKGISTTGTIAGGSLNTLTLTSNPGFAVGDKIIVEIGGEAGGGQRATVGVGGTWPALHYPNAATRLADTTQPAGTYAYDDDTGLGQLYFWGGAVWGSIVVGADNFVNEKVIPQALAATITAIDITGKILTLGTSATVPTINANVYFDNMDKFLSVLFPTTETMIPLEPSNITVSIPAGTFACRNQMSTMSIPGYVGRVGWTITGAGVNSTFIKAPYGAPCTGINMVSCNSSSIQNLTVLGNFRTTWGFMFNPPSGNFNAWSRGSQYSALGTLCTDCTITNVNTVDISSENGAVGWKTSGGCIMSNCTVTLTTGFAMEAWCFNIADSSNCHGYDCTSVSQTFISAHQEIDNSTNCSFVRSTVHNGFYSVNSCDGWLLLEPTQIIDGNNDNPFRSTQPGSGFQINNNRFNQTGTGPAPGAGGKIVNPTILTNGYHNGVDLSWGGGAINISDARCVNCWIIGDPPWTQRAPNSSLTKGYIKMPAYAGNPSYTGTSINNGQAPNVIISGIRCDSTATTNGTANDLLNNKTGCVTQNCIVETFGLQTTGSNCLTHAQWNALPLITLGAHQ